MSEPPYNRLVGLVYGLKESGGQLRCLDQLTDLDLKGLGKLVEELS